MAIGDLNGDGRPDLAVANERGLIHNDVVSVLLGNGDGSFGVSTSFGTGYAPYSVAIGDLNGDGKPDLAVANNSGASNSVSVLLGNGAGSFGPKTDFPTGSRPISLVIADLNGDGKPELVTANQGSNTVSVLRGNGDGTFRLKTDVATGTVPYSVAIGELNGGCNPDLVVATPATNTVSVFLSYLPSDFGTGTGGPVGVAIGDVNGDGRPDLVTANFGSDPDYVGTVSVLLGNGDGSFGAKTDFGTGSGPNSLVIADLNGDAKLDLATANVVSNTVSVLLGNGDGSFGAKTDFATGSEPFSVAVADLNGDGKLDLVTANPSSTAVSVLLNTTATVSVELAEIPARFELAPPHPNPFGSGATLDFDVPKPAFIRLEIYDAQGRRIKTLEDGILAPGHYTRSWDGETASGSEAGQGVYFVRFSAPGVHLTREAVLVR